MASLRSAGNRGKSGFGGLRSESSRDRLIFNDVEPSAEHTMELVRETIRFLKIFLYSSSKSTLISSKTEKIKKTKK